MRNCGKRRRSFVDDNTTKTVVTAVLPAVEVHKTPAVSRQYTCGSAAVVPCPKMVEPRRARKYLAFRVRHRARRQLILVAFRQIEKRCAGGCAHVENDVTKLTSNVAPILVWRGQQPEQTSTHNTCCINESGSRNLKRTRPTSAHHAFIHGAHPFDVRRPTKWPS